MTYGECRDFILQLLNQYSISGKEIEASYNNHADYLNRIPSLINEGMEYIATHAKRILDKSEISQELCREQEGLYVYDMPDEAWMIKSGGLMRIMNGEVDRVVNYWKEGSSLYIPKEFLSKGKLYVQFFRHARLLSPENDESEVLDNSIDTHAVVAYYAASQLARYDDAYDHSTLNNDFEIRMSRLTNGQYAEHGLISDVYGGAQVMNYGY